MLSFQIQNKYLVEGMDVVIRYGLYNVGDTVASDIVLTEAGFGTDDFDVAGTVLTYIYALWLGVFVMYSFAPLISHFIKDRIPLS